MNTLVVIQPNGVSVMSAYKGSEPELKVLQAAVGGFVEHIRVRYEGKIRHAYVNEEGLYEHMPLNSYTTEIASEFGYGTIIIVKGEKP